HVAIRTRDDGTGLGPRLSMGHRVARSRREALRGRVMSGPLTPSQTVGPFFGVGLPFEKGEQLAPPGSASAMRIEGQVLDGKGEPVPDALLEIWQPGTGFGRARTDSEGAFSFTAVKPGPVPASDGRMQAPHFNVTVFARGLLRHLVT